MERKLQVLITQLTIAANEYRETSRLLEGGYLISPTDATARTLLGDFDAHIAAYDVLGMIGCAALMNAVRGG